MPSFSRVNNTQALGGEAQGTLTDPTACMEGCIQNADCVAVDLDFNQNAVLCWFHFNRANLDNTRPATNTYHFVVQERCKGGEGEAKFSVDLLL